MPHCGKEKRMSYSATIVISCNCGTENHVIMECDDDPKDLHSVQVNCCHCSAVIGQVAALSARTRASAEEALRDWITDHSSTVRAVRR